MLNDDPGRSAPHVAARRRPGCGDLCGRWIPIVAESARACVARSSLWPGSARQSGRGLRVALGDGPNYCLAVSAAPPKRPGHRGRPEVDASRRGAGLILPKERDPRFAAFRRSGGSHRFGSLNLAECCCAVALRSVVALTGCGTVACCFVTISSVTDPAGTARICGDHEVTTTNFRRLGRTLGASPGQRTTAGADNESRGC